MRTSFKYRIYPTKKQRRILNQQLEECRWLYNHLLEERKTLWEDNQESISLYEQQLAFKSLKLERPLLKKTYSQILMNVSVRIDLAMKAFFRRVKAGEKPGYPRFKGYGRYSSITFPQSPRGAKLEGGYLKVSKVGDIKCVVHRPIEGTPKTTTIRRSSTGKWYVSISCEWEPIILEQANQSVGIDVGLKTFATFSDGQEIDNPRFFRKEEKELAKVQRNLSMAEKGTKERHHKRKIVARVHERIKWRRDNFTHQKSRKIVNQFDFIAVEDLRINNMVHNHCLAKSIHDASWGMFAELLRVKAEWAGRTYIAVNPAYTSQNCSSCGHRKSDLTLSDRIYQCTCCGIEIDRDLNASKNILALGQQCLT